MNKLLLILSVFIFINCSADNDWTPIFNGQNLDGWHSYGAEGEFNGWFVEDGILVFDPQKRTEARSSYLTTDKQYKDFELSFEWLIAENGNSGVFWGVVEDGTNEFPYHTGPEIQILDDGYEEYIAERGDINRAGSLYNLMAPSQIVSKHANQWNHYLIHIDQTNNEGFLVFNDVEVLRFPVNGPEWEALIANSPASKWEGFGKTQTGHISFQDWGGQVAFRNIKIRVLNQ
ncbi:MAG: DUF1080 domain-containing protein [Cyclobacteriaceae bacterium]